MNEQLAAIKARRDAITPGVWEGRWTSETEDETGETRAWVEGPTIIGLDWDEVTSQAARDARFVDAAPADIDTLLAEVERLTGEEERAESLQAEVMICHGLLESLTPGGSEFSEWPERCAAWVQERLGTRAQVAAERNALREQVAALTAERDALAQQLQQAQAQLANERAIMNLVPEYIRYLSAWRAGDGRFLVFNEWVAQRVEQAATTPSA